MAHATPRRLSSRSVGHFRLNFSERRSFSQHIGNSWAHLPARSCRRQTATATVAALYRVLLPQRWLKALPPACLLSMARRTARCDSPYTGSLLEQEGVLLHPRDRVEIGKPQAHRSPATQPSSAQNRACQERKELLRLHLDALDDWLAKRGGQWNVTWRSGVFAAIVKNLMGLVVLSISLV